MIRSSLALIAAAMIATSAQAQTGEWPTKPIRLIAPFPPASTADVIGRVLGQKLSQRLGQPVVIDNRVGASGNLGADAIAKAAPDGYTIGIVTSSTHAVAVSLSSKLPYDPLKDFTPITMIANSPYVLVLYPGVPAKDVKELVALAKAKPGTLNFGSSGNGSTNHLAGELLKSMTGINIVHLPYRGAAPAMNDLIAGHIPMMFDNIPAVLPQVQGKAIKAIAVAGAKRAAALPDVPTVAESGVPGFEASAWFGLVAPAKTPAPVLAKLESEVDAILKMPDVQKRFTELGAESGNISGAAFGNFLADETAKWTKIIQSSGATIN
jgi:tripartite-type tricarboxylate transporter receptor subunit TctC